VVGEGTEERKGILDFSFVNFLTGVVEDFFTIQYGDEGSGWGLRQEAR